MLDDSPEQMDEPNSQEYRLMLELEDLESLLEEIEETEAQGEDVRELSHRLSFFGVHSVGELQTRIADLHIKLDAASQD
jgi:hypothetical protein